MIGILFPALTTCFCSLDLQSCYSQPNGKKVACGAWKLDSVDTNEEALEIAEIINHPEYNPSTFENDIAVLKVSGTFTCEQGKIWPACLPNEEVSFLYTNTNLIIFVYPLAL